MLGNNETGVLQPVREAAAVCRQYGVRLHTDAIQCVGKITVHFRDLGVDALSVSAHKFHGPAGIGALLMRHGVALQPILFGGFQQTGIRPGTEPVTLAVGMHRALQLWQSEGESRTTKLRLIRDTFESELERSCPDVIFHGDAVERLPHTSCVAFPGIDRQALVMALDMAQLACSTGSACASGSSEPSPVLQAMNLAPELIGSSLRFSFSLFTTLSEVRDAVQRISQVVNDLRQPRKSASGSATPPKHAVKPI
jgi:cysteine desulfurase